MKDAGYFDSLVREKIRQRSRCGDRDATDCGLPAVADSGAWP